MNPSGMCISTCLAYCNSVGLDFYAGGFDEHGERHVDPDRDDDVEHALCSDTGLERVQRRIRQLEVVQELIDRGD